MRVFEFVVELYHFQPKIWRRVLVPANITIARLGYICMTLFEMKSSHLAAIEYKTRNEKIKFDINEDVRKPGKDASTAYLSNLALTNKSKLKMVYDFGDTWEVFLILDRIYCLPLNMLDTFPRVVEGEGYGIVEDCGGGDGLARVMKAFAAKSGDEYKELSAKLGRKSFNFDKFSISRANERLRIVPGIYEQIYEGRISPTDEEKEYVDEGMI
jgi:hypothetical protein